MDEKDMDTKNRDLVNLSDIEIRDFSVIDEAKSLWQLGDWQSLSKINPDKIQHNLDKGIVALFVGIANLQLNNEEEGKRLIKLAKECGISKSILSKILISSLHITMGRIYLAKSRDDKAVDSFKEALKLTFPHLRNKILGETLACVEAARMGLLPQAVKFLDFQMKEHDGTRREKKARLKILETEMEIIKHELSLAIQRHQLFSTSQKQNKDHQYGSEEWLRYLKKKSLSQLGQDLWVLERTNYKRNGFFVEIGASDGIMLSNTYLLEKEFGWHGICVEPNPKFFEKLKMNRSCILSNYYVDKETGKELEFVIADVYSSSTEYAFSDLHKELREAYAQIGNIIKVVTISLNGLLEFYQAPKDIDYISIDTEGNEFDILSSFDFDKWNVHLFTIEHNYTENRQKIFELMSKHGYVRIEREWDDWYEKIE